MLAKLTLDKAGYDKGLDEATGKASGFGNKLKSGMAVAGKAVLGAVTAAATAIGTLGVASVKAYAEQEQLIGGVETLFKTSAAQVIGYANNAYKTAGMTANEYMTTVTGFSASLLQGLNGDTAAAANIANLAITDMSDNVNKMGTTMEMVQNTYSGLARQNFMMLDNLHIGYQGTAAEMARLINDSKVMGDSFVATAENVKDISFDKYIEAIHVVQTEMGITGTTAKEAATTISGSAAMMRTAWQNLVVGLADDNADLGQLIGNVAESANTFAQNIMPRITTVMSSIGTAINTFAPLISTALTTIFTDVLPGLVSSAGDLVLSIVTAITNNLPQIATAATQIITTLVSGLASALPTLIPAAAEAVVAIVLGLVQNIPQLITAALQLIQGLADGLIAALPIIIDALPEIINALVNGLLAAAPQLITMGIMLIGQLVLGLIKALPNIVQAAWEIIKGFISALASSGAAQSTAGGDIIKRLAAGALAMVGTAFTATINAIKSVFTNAKEAVQTTWSSIVSFFSNIWNGIKAVFAVVASFFGTSFTGAKTAITNAVSSIPAYFSQLWSNIKSVFSSVGSWFSSVGQAIVSGIRNGISAGWSALTGFVAEKAKSLLNAAKSALGIASPSKVFRDEVGVMLAKGIAQGFSLEMPRTVRNIQNQLDFTKSLNVPSGSVSRETLGGLGGVTIIQNIYSEAKTAADLMREARWEAQKAVLTGV